MSNVKVVCPSSHHKKFILLVLELMTSACLQSEVVIYYQAEHTFAWWYPDGQYSVFRKPQAAV